ncbi:unnamed protein product [Arctogadus glacialis]
METKRWNCWQLLFHLCPALLTHSPLSPEWCSSTPVRCPQLLSNPTSSQSCPDRLIQSPRTTLQTSNQLVGWPVFSKAEHIDFLCLNSSNIR